MQAHDRKLTKEYSYFIRSSCCYSTQTLFVKSWNVLPLVLSDPFSSTNVNGMALLSQKGYCYMSPPVTTWNADVDTYLSRTSFPESSEPVGFTLRAPYFLPFLKEENLRPLPSPD